MNSYCAFLGNHPSISVAELQAAIPDCMIDTIVDKKIAIFSSSFDLKPDFIDRLGGTIILAKQLTNKSVDIADIPKMLNAEFSSIKRGKITFSLRCHGIKYSSVRDLYRTCKQRLKKSDHPSRYVGTEKKAAQAVVLHENDMISGKYGCEIVAIRYGDEDSVFTWIGKTIGAQNIDAYTKRDIEKPVRDTSVGLLPPKLAQILLNLGIWAAENKPGVRKKKPSKKLMTPELTVYDPFCGTGVIPMECLLRGCHVVASDVSKKAVDDCTTNTEWLRKEENILKKDVSTTIFKHDATKDFDTKHAPDVLVTETTLGPNLTRRSTLKEAQKNRTEIESIEAAFIKNAAKNYPGVPIVCTFPIWYASKSSIRLEKIWKVIKEAGYEPQMPSDSAAKDVDSLTYHRSGQFVGREIVVLMPANQ